MRLGHLFLVKATSGLRDELEPDMYWTFNLTGTPTVAF
jgi:hypothetical protein